MLIASLLLLPTHLRIGRGNCVMDDDYPYDGYDYEDDYREESCE